MRESEDRRDNKKPQGKLVVRRDEALSAVFGVLIVVAMGIGFGKIVGVESANDRAIQNYRLNQLPRQMEERLAKLRERDLPEERVNEEAKRIYAALYKDAMKARPTLSANDRSRWATIRALVEKDTRVYRFAPVMSDAEKEARAQELAAETTGEAPGFRYLPGEILINCEADCPEKIDSSKIQGKRYAKKLVPYAIDKTWETPGWDSIDVVKHALPDEKWDPSNPASGYLYSSKPTLLPTLLQNKPLFPDDETADPFISLQQRPKKTNLTGNVILDFKPLSDLTIRPNVGFSRQTERSYQVEWGPETAQINDIQICDWSLLQYGLDASYNHWFKDNSSLKLDLTLRGQHESTDAMKGLAYTRKSYDELWLKKYDYDGAYSIIEGLIEALKKMSIDEYPFGYYGSIRTENYKADWFDGSFRMAFDWKRYLNLNAGLYWLRSSTGAAEHGYFVPVAGASWNIKRTLESMDIYVFPISNWDLGASWSGTNRYNSAFAAAPTRFQEPFLYPGKTAPQDVSTRFEINSSLNLDLTESLLSFRVSWYDDRDDYSFQTSTNDKLLLRNRGWLFDVNLQRWSGPVQYSFGASLSLYENQCLEMPQMIENFPLYYEQNSSTLVIHKGKPLGIAYLYPSGTGLDEWPYAETRQFLGNGIFPTSVLALHASLTWKNWSFTARAHGNFGQSIQRTMEYVPDPLASYLMDQGLKYNELTRPAYRTPEFCLFDGSFFRIDQIRLDYSLHYPHTKLRWNLFVSLENFFLFTSYPGTDPEYTLNWDSAGIDLGTYPSTRRIVFGTKIDL